MDLRECFRLWIAFVGAALLASCPLRAENVVALADASHPSPVVPDLSGDLAHFRAGIGSGVFFDVSPSKRGDHTKSLLQTSSLVAPFLLQASAKRRMHPLLNLAASSSQVGNGIQKALIS